MLFVELYSNLMAIIVPDIFAALFNSIGRGDGMKYFLIAVLLLISYKSFSQRVSVGESNDGDSIYFEFDFPREMKIEIFNEEQKIQEVPPFKGVKWFYLEKPKRFVRIIETDVRTMKVIFFDGDIRFPQGKVLFKKMGQI